MKGGYSTFQANWLGSYLLAKIEGVDLISDKSRACLVLSIRFLFIDWIILIYKNYKVYIKQKSYD